MNIPPKTTPESSRAVVERLTKALTRDGDFPASAKIVHEVTSLAKDPKASATQLSDIIMRDPILGARIIGITNSAHYQRGRSILTVNQAVMTLGMQAVAELCSSLAMLQRFVPLARQGSAFAEQIRRAVITSLLSAQLTHLLARETRDSEEEKKGESGQLFGLFAEIGPLLLAFYFPKLYTEAVSLVRVKTHDFDQALKQVTGYTPVELSIEVMRSVQLPSQYAETLTFIVEDDDGIPNFMRSPPGKTRTLAASVWVARTISRELSPVIVTEDDLSAAILKIPLSDGITMPILMSALSAIVMQFTDYQRTINIKLRALPDCLDESSFSGKCIRGTAAEVPKGLRPLEEKQPGASSAGGGFSTSSTVSSGPSALSRPLALRAPARTATPPPRPSQRDPVQKALDEVRSAVEAREPTSSILTAAMEALRWGMKMDRVVLMVKIPDSNELRTKMSLFARRSMDPGELTIIETMDNVVTAALTEGRPLFTGDPLLEGGWPIVGIPVGVGDRCVGVLYADCLDNDQKPELSLQERASLGVLTDILDKAVTQKDGKI